MKLTIVKLTLLIPVLSIALATPSLATTLPPVNHKFFASVMIETPSPSGMGVSYTQGRVELIEIKTDGTLTREDFTADSNLRNSVIASGKNGHLLHAVNLGAGKVILKSYLFKKGKYARAGIKTNYIEPGVLDNQNQYVYGRAVKDGVNSTRISRQSVRTGALSYHFDSARNGGGYLCGVATDQDFELAYFTQLLPKKTILYRLDLNNGKYKKINEFDPGFCVDTVIDKNRLAGTFIDPKNDKWDSKKLAFVDLGQSKKLAFLEVDFNLAWISEHQMVVAGNYLYLFNPFNSRNIGSHIYIDLRLPFGDQGAVIAIDAVGNLEARYQTINYLPAKLR